MLQTHHGLFAGLTQIENPLFVTVLDVTRTGRPSEIPSGVMVCAHTFSSVGDPAGSSNADRAQRTELRETHR